MLFKQPRESVASVKCALGKIDLLFAFFAFVRPVKFIGKDFHLETALGAVAHKGFQMFELFKSRAMLGGAHMASLLIKIITTDDYLPVSIKI